MKGRETPRSEKAGGVVSAAHQEITQDTTGRDGSHDKSGRNNQKRNGGMIAVSVVGKRGKVDTGTCGAKGQDKQKTGQTAEKVLVGS